MQDENGRRRWKGEKIDGTPDGRSMAKRELARNAKKESSKRWIERQLRDPYVKLAKSAGYRSRAAFKLKELDNKFSLIRPNMRVLDLGCAPGGWLQLLRQYGVKALVGIDLLPVKPLTGVNIIQGDVNEPAVREEALYLLGGAPDLILSDMAASTTGHRKTDHLRTIALAETACQLAIEVLAPKGIFCAKVFQGGASDDMLNLLRPYFTQIRHAKPPASRIRSPETYVIAKGFQSSNK